MSGGVRIIPNPFAGSRTGSFGPCPSWVQLSGWSFLPESAHPCFRSPHQAGGTLPRGESGPAAAQTQWSRVASALPGPEVPRAQVQQASAGSAQVLAPLAAPCRAQHTSFLLAGHGLSARQGEG